MRKRVLDVKRRMPPLVQALLESSLLILFSVVLLLNLAQPAAGAKRVILRDPAMIAILTILLLLVFSMAIVLTSNYRRALKSKNPDANLRTWPRSA